MKKLLHRRVPSVLLAMLLAIGSFSVSGLGDVVSVPILGDINQDQIIDATDALLALQYSVELTVLNEERLEAADVDANVVIDANDALFILQYSVKLIERFPAEDSPAYKAKLLANIGKDSPVPFSLVYCKEPDYNTWVDGVDAPELFDEFIASMLITDADEMKTRFGNAESPILSNYAAACDDAFFQERAVLVLWHYLPSFRYHAAIDCFELEENTLIVDCIVRKGDPDVAVEAAIGHAFVLLEIDAQTAAEISEITWQVHEEHSTEEYDDVWAVGMDDYLS